MKQEKINRAYNSLSKLVEYNLPLKKARGIYKLMKSVEDAYQFAANEERKYLSEYKGVIKDDNTITFETPTDCSAFQDRLAELIRMDVDIEIDTVVLTEQDIGEQKLMPMDIYNLEGFVIFE